MSGAKSLRAWARTNFSNLSNYWQQSLASRVPGGLDPDVTDRAVTAGCLVGAADFGAAMQLLAVIPDLADDGRPRGAVARWLHDLYPAPAGASGEAE